MSKDDEIRAGAAILKDLSLFNKAAIFFEEQIDPVIRTAVTEFLTAWIEKHGWRGEPDVSDKIYDMWVCPTEWETEDGHFAKFKFGYKANVETNSYVIADLFGVGQSSFGFRFEVEYTRFQGKNAWKTYAKTLSEDFQSLDEFDWVHEGNGVFFLPVILPASMLVSAWENEDWDKALVPLGQALDALVASKPIFDNIIAKAKPKPEQE